MTDDYTGEPMRFVSTDTDGQWEEIYMGPTTDPEGDSHVKQRGAMLSSLLDILKAENLTILCGLGTSLCVKGAGDGSQTQPERLAPTMPDLWNAAKEDVLFTKVLDTVKVNEVPVDDDIEKLLSRCHLARELNNDETVRTFIERTEGMIIERCDFVREKTNLDVHEDFLRRVARRPPQVPRAKLFTTNYDQCFDAAAARSGFIAVDGFTYTYPHRFDSSHYDYDFVRRTKRSGAPEFIPGVFHLYKLHGSVNWERANSDVHRVQGKPERPVLIYPRSSKFESSYQPPFVELMGRFQAALREDNAALMVIGFGFGDSHLTQPILSAIKTNVGLRVLVVDPKLDSLPNEAVREINRLIRAGDRRLSMLQARFEDLVPVLPDLVPTTEDERHRYRLQGGTNGPA